MPSDLQYTFLHGWGVSPSIWQGFAESLTDSSKVSMPCLYDLANKTKDNSFVSMANVLNKTTKSDTVLISWSIGGLVAMPLAKLTDKIKAIVFVASTPCFVNKKDWSYTIDKKGIDDLQAMLLKTPSGALEYFAGLIAHGDKSIKETNKKIRNNLAEEKHSQILSSWLKQMEKTDQRDEFSGLSLPMQFIFGENDSLINSEINNQLIQLNRNIQSKVISNCGHAPFISKKEETIKTINEFIDAKLNG